MKQQLRETMKEAYREYVNDYLTVEKFAEHNEISETVAGQIIAEGKRYHEMDVPFEQAKARRAGK